MTCGPYIPRLDSSGRVITDLPTAEIERRLLTLRKNNDKDPITVQYARAYDAAIRNRTK
jgi:hypothetical protein